MKTEEILKQYQELHDSLKKKKSVLIEEIQKIDKALSTNGGQLNSEKCEFDAEGSYHRDYKQDSKNKETDFERTHLLGISFFNNNTY